MYQTFVNEKTSKLEQKRAKDFAHNWFSQMEINILRIYAKKFGFFSKMKIQNFAYFAWFCVSWPLEKGHKI